MRKKDKHTKKEKRDCNRRHPVAAILLPIAVGYFADNIPAYLPSALRVTCLALCLIPFAVGYFTGNRGHMQTKPLRPAYM